MVKIQNCQFYDTRGRAWCARAWLCMTYSENAIISFKIFFSTLGHDSDKLST